MSFDVRDHMPDERIACDGCSQLVHAVAVHSVKIGPFVPGGPTKWVQWKSCAECQAKDEARWAEQRRDEERELAEREERSKRAAERDQQRAEKQRSTGNRSVA
jgi:hypothetical protein